MKRERREFTKEFKREAVRLLTEGRRSSGELAGDLGVAASLLYRWRRQRLVEGSEAFRGNGNRTELEEENRRLRREVHDLREERDILKKFTAYSAKHLR